MPYIPETPHLGRRLQARPTKVKLDLSAGLGRPQCRPGRVKGDGCRESPFA